ncbi:ABC transporter ATP-binding protein [Exiguobacterium sp. s130]|uniref:ABC transporter ATP-binding protein n=1 Tax=Exiguobacterium sp. s130 TaxID=2751190 RepID=UPI001BE8ED5F|nr:ABC transporter ATP-binding protein [Exiguobacterium sp. s130]
MRGGARIKPILAVDGLTVRTKQQVTLIEGVTFSIQPGQILGLVGESGCGKTVTSLALMRLLNPQTTDVTGDIRLNGKSILSLSERAVRSIRGGEIAFIMQNPMSAFTPVYSIGHQMIETIQTHSRCSKREAKQQAMTALEEVNLTDAARLLKAYPFELSGGMLQRIMIALAVALRPSVLIADEPTTALDVFNQKTVLELLERMRATYGTAMLLISHDLGVIAELADDVLVMQQGRIVEQADVFELFDRPQHPYTQSLLAQHIGREAFG